MDKARRYVKHHVITWIGGPWGALGRFLARLGLLKACHESYYLSEPEFVGAIPARVEVTIPCDHESSGKRIIFDEPSGDPHIEQGRFVEAAYCVKCGTPMGYWLVKDVKISNGVMHASDYVENPGWLRIGR